jgi:pimeloyl-ACP methyl ester carboxylesterase
LAPTDALSGSMRLMKRASRVGLILFAVLAAIAAVFVAINWVPDRPVSALVGRWAQPPSRFLDAGGMKVHLRDEGVASDPIPVVLIHGTSSSLHTWDGWARDLKATRRVITFDLPGFGLTGPSPKANYSIDAYVTFMGAFLDALDIRRCVLGGNSLGGNVAWETAYAMPGRIEKLILVDAGGYPLNPTSIPIGFRLAGIPVLNRLMENILPRSLIEASLRKVYGDPSKITAETVDLYFDMATREGNRQALARRFQQSDFGARADRIATLKTPTLIIWGGLDGLIPPSNAERFHRDIQGGELVIFPELGHVPQEEDPVRTVAAARAFLAKP